MKSVHVLCIYKQFPSSYKAQLPDCFLVFTDVQLQPVKSLGHKIPYHMSRCTFVADQNCVTCAMLWNGVKASCDTLWLWNHLREGVCALVDVCRCVLSFNAIRNVIQLLLLCLESLWKNFLFLFYFVHERAWSWCKQPETLFPVTTAMCEILLNTKGRGTRNDERLC